MSDELQLVLAVVAVFVIYVLARVLSYIRQSDAEWKQADKTKLKQWEDEDD